MLCRLLGDGLYVISVAARLLEMHPQTLRKYERVGLVMPSRTVGMLRLYSEEDIVRLRLIKHLIGDLGLKLSGVELNSLLDVRDVNENVNLFMDIIKNIYLENSNMTEEQLEKYFIRDKWMSAKEALNYGLIDEIIY